MQSKDRSHYTLDGDLKCNVLVTVAIGLGQASNFNISRMHRLDCCISLSRSNLGIVLENYLNVSFNSGDGLWTDEFSLNQKSNCRGKRT